MIHPRRTLAGPLAALAALVILLPAGAVRAAGVLPRIPVTVATTLVPNTAYSFQFSLHTAAATSTANRVWGPATATLTVAADRTITYTLGAKPSFGAGVNFSQQLYLQVTGGGKKVIVPLGAAPYALWSPASEIPGPQGNPGPDGLACWDTNANGDCDGAEDRVGGDGCNAADCRGLDGTDGVDGFDCWDLNRNHSCDKPGEDRNGDLDCTVLDCRGDKGDPGESFTLTCQDGEAIVWGAAAGQWQCGPALAGGPTAYYLDADHDGFGTTACDTPLQGSCTATEAGDADDANCLVNPDMVWFLNSRSTTNPLWCLNGDANPACQIYFQSLGAGGTTVTGWFDRDGDGYFTTTPETLPVWFGSCLAGATASPGPAADKKNDCDNLDPSFRPGLIDGCDGLNQDCDLLIDEDCP